MELREILDARSVSFLSGITSKKRLLQSDAEQAETVFGLNARDIITALKEREDLGSTGVGRGVAIPHARFEGLDRVYGFFTRLEKPIDFDAVDKQPVDLFFTLLAPKTEGAEHLKALALVSRTLRSEDMCKALRSNETSDSLLALLTQQTTFQAA